MNYISVVEQRLQPRADRVEREKSEGRGEQRRDSCPFFRVIWSGLVGARACTVNGNRVTRCRWSVGRKISEQCYRWWKGASVDERRYPDRDTRANRSILAEQPGIMRASPVRNAKAKRELASSKRANNAGCRRWLNNVWLAKSPYGTQHTDAHRMPNNARCTGQASPSTHPLSTPSPSHTFVFFSSPPSFRGAALVRVGYPRYLPLDDNPCLFSSEGLLDAG